MPPDPDLWFPNQCPLAAAAMRFVGVAMNILIGPADHGQAREAIKNTFPEMASRESTGPPSPQPICLIGADADCNDCQVGPQ